MLEFASWYEEERFNYSEHPEGQRIIARYSVLARCDVLYLLSGSAQFLPDLGARNQTIYLSRRQGWRKIGGRQSISRRSFVQDADGYALIVGPEHR